MKERTIKAKKTFPEDVELTNENAAIESAKAMREIRDSFRQLTITDAGRLRVSSFSKGGTIEHIKRLMETALRAEEIKAKLARTQKNISERLKEEKQAATYA